MNAHYFSTDLTRSNTQIDHDINFDIPLTLRTGIFRIYIGSAIHIPLLMSHDALEH